MPCPWRYCHVQPLLCLTGKLYQVKHWKILQTNRGVKGVSLGAVDTSCRFKPVSTHIPGGPLSVPFSTEACLLTTVAPS